MSAAGSVWLWLAPAVGDNGGHASSPNRQQHSQWILLAGRVPRGRELNAGVVVVEMG